MWSPEFAVPPGQTRDIKPRINSWELLWGGRYTAQVVITNNSQNHARHVIDFTLSTPRDPKIVEIESLNKEGKWRLAFEKFDAALRIQTSNRNEVRKQIIATRNGSILSTAVFAGLVYFTAVFLLERQGKYGTDALALCVGILALVAGGFFQVRFGGHRGRVIDYAFGLLFPTLFAIQAIFLIVFICFPLALILNILGVYKPFVDFLSRIVISLIEK